MYKIIGADQKEYGPVTAEQIRQWVAEGRANGQTLVLPDGATEWKPLSAHPEFAGASHASAAPPPFASATKTQVEAGAIAGQILAGEAVFSIGSCLRRSFSLLQRDFGVLAGATCLIWLIETVLMFVPIVGALVAWLLGGIFYGGLFMVYLKRIRGEDAAIGDAFSGFRISTVQLLLAGLLTSLLGTLAMLCCLILPGIYLMVAWCFSLLLVMDRQLEFWSAMELSRKVATRVWFRLFLLLTAVFSPVLLFAMYTGVRNGIIVFSMMQDGPPDMEKAAKMISASLLLRVIGRLALLVCLPVALGAMANAYEDLFGPRAARTS
jgi:hypothetical protein